MNSILKPLTQEENTLQPYAAWSWKLRFGLIGSLLASIATIGIVAAFAVHEKSSPSKDLEAIGFRGLNREIQSRLNPTFVDNDNDLLADALSMQNCSLHLKNWFLPTITATMKACLGSTGKSCVSTWPPLSAYQ